MASSNTNAASTSFGTNLGESHFFDESMHPSTIVQYLTNTDPTNTISSNNYYLQAMKWLLASMSKGRDVSDFFPHVVKLVSISNLEIRKMVYIFLIQYADHNDACRELCLLSINGFQRGLGDGEQLIRALALRVMSSIRVMDILQIQILAIQKCAKDTSPYVRKCAANAICKVFPFCSSNDNDEAQSLLRDVLKHLLEEDVSTMVLTSAMIAFHETCFPNNLEILHQSYRKLCHLLTDMDEWGQVVCMEVLMRYCRLFFRPPSLGDDTIGELQDGGLFGATNTTTSLGVFESKKKVKRSSKGFYSDEEDSSDEDDEEFQDDLVFIQPAALKASVSNKNTTAMNMYDDLDADHKLLLQSSWPLLKSRNSAVVLAVCSLHYYCSGKDDANTRHAIGKALVRICRDKREISFVVLQSIKCLIVEDYKYREVFVPFINDFFIKATDISFVRMLKIDILTRLALTERSINTILSELKSYVRHHDKVFVQTCIEAIATICETSFHRKYINDTSISSETSHTICLNCLYGLSTLTYVSQNALVVGQAVISICHIFRLLLKEKHVHDMNSIRAYALKRVVYLFLKSLEILSSDDHPTSDDTTKSRDESEGTVVIKLPSMALASSIYILGELWSSSNKLLDSVLEPTNPQNIQIVILQLLIQSFTDLEVTVKLPAIHLASKLFVLHKLGDSTNSEVLELAEALLSLARLDVNQDIRDRARFESQVLQSSIGFTFHTDTLHTISSYTHDKQNVMAKSMFQNSVPPFNTALSTRHNNDLKEKFRFGTLSSFVHHSTQMYHDLPPWASRNSPTSLRDPPDATSGLIASSPNTESTSRQIMPTTKAAVTSKHDNFYASSSDSSSEDDDNDSSSLDSSSEDESSTTSSSGEDESSDDSNPQQNQNTKNVPTMAHNQPSLVESTSSSDEDSSSEDDEDSTSSESQNKTPSPSKSALLIPTTEPMDTITTNDTTTLAHDLQGLVMTPLIHDTSSKSTTTTKIQQDEENNSSQYYTPIKQELSGGLFFQMRYLRNSVKNKQLDVMNLSINPSSFVILLQLTFENRRMDNGVIRRIRILHRGAKSSSSICPRKVILYPPEIPSLSSKHKTSAYLAMEYPPSLSSNNNLAVKLEMKTDRGSYPIDFKIPFCEGLSSVIVTKSDFVKGMSLFSDSQRLKYVFLLKEQQQHDVTSIWKKIVKYSNLTPVDNCYPENDSSLACSFTSSIPSTGEILYVTVKLSPKRDAGEVISCSYDAIATAALLQAVKLAFA